MSFVITFYEVCRAEGCAGKVLAKELCSKHYQRKAKYGSPYVTVNRPPSYPRIAGAKYAKEWRAKHPDRWKKIASEAKVLRRCRAMSVGIEKFKRESIFVRDKGLCAYCGLGLDPQNWHLDHVVPLAKGGSHSRANCVAACPMCNRKKSNKDIARFRSEVAA